MNEFWAQGWELVSASPGTSTGMIFKRPGHPFPPTGGAR